MTRPLTTASIVGTALFCAVLWPVPAYPQQSSARSGSPVPRATQAPQGFSVVLVVGDVQAAGGDEDVPMAARRALADMKDFLPYKSYKLVDAAWIVGTSHAVSRLRGPEDREYELEINASESRGRLNTSGLTPNAGDSRISVTFSLRDAGSGRGEGVDSVGSGSGSGSGASGDSLPALHRQLEILRNQYAEAKAKYSGQHPELQRLSREIEAMEQTIEARQRQVERRTVAQGRTSGRAVINTSFTMDIGETVVVGTSRLSGNSKALIALLTAVPQKSSRR